MELLTLALEAHSRERNHHRRYEVVIGRDLLNDWTVSIFYGRVGQSGHRLLYGASDPAVIREIIRDRLQRRLSAPKRIGCSYRLTAFSVAMGFDVSLCLPGELIRKFLQG